MAISSANAAAAPKTRKVETLLSGTSWTVPTGVEYVNVLLVGGGGGAGGNTYGSSISGLSQAAPGNCVSSTVTTTPGASIAYAIGAGGAGGSAPNGEGSNGGTTTFTGATSATGGIGGKVNNTGATGSVGFATNQGLSPQSEAASKAGGTGGNGWIEIEYWV